MTLRHLEIFLTVCEFESITKASDKLNITQPATSIAISELESFYNTKLFERMNRRIYLTQAGETLLQYAHSILTQFDESVQILRDRAFTASCKIGINVSFAETRFMDFLAKFTSIHPEMNVQTFIDSTEEIEQKLRMNEIDFAIVDQFSTNQSWQTKPLYTENMIVAHAPLRDASLQKISLKDLSQFPLLLREKGSGSRNAIEETFAKHHLPASPYIESTSTLALTNAAIAGLGYLIVPPETVTTQLQTQQLQRVSVIDAEFTRQYFLIMHKNKYMTKPMQKIMDQLYTDIQNT